LTQGAIVRNPRTKYKRSKNVSTVTSIELICARVYTQLLQPLAQSLIGSPGTLLTTETRLEIFGSPDYPVFLDSLLRDGDSVYSSETLL